MKGLEEIAIIHSVDDYPVGLFLKENFKLEGFSYFVYAYNQLDDAYNDILAKSDNQFDLILYVNDQNDKWQRRFGHLGRHNLNIELINGEIWKKPGQLNDDKLKAVWKKILREVFEDSSDLVECINIMDVISKVYCKYDLFRKLLNNTESWFMQIKNVASENIYRNSLEQQKKVWHAALRELQQFSDGIGVNRVMQGQEHLDYAILYCKRKINDICDLLGTEFEYDSWSLLSEADEILEKYNLNFYMIENIIAKNARKSREYRGLALLAMKNCTLNCKVPACNSFHFYRLGKLYEKFDKIIQSEDAYEEAYQLNPLNFRALYKVVVNFFSKKYYEAARDALKEIIDLLQIPTGDINTVTKIIRKLPALELEYVCKCYFFLSEIEKREEHMDYQYYNYCKEIIDLIVKIISDNQSDFMKNMYADQLKYGQYLKSRLSTNSIKEKVKIY